MSNDKGFSLVEVLVGLAIFSVGALASAMLITASLNQNQVAKERTRLSSIVSQRLEELRGRPWNSLGGGPSLQSGGAIYDDEALRNYSSGMTEGGFSETFDYTLSGPADDAYMRPFYLVMWRIENLTDSGLDFKRITIRGVSMRYNDDAYHWLPVASFDHVAMVFREIKAN
ncbi:MAG TPA: prepilin-type N-terminal cleavage/methylation domain-containing protein [Acidobacteriota bacterium]|nr:prepilin-type N-terminal cleavage/methylation domain-containing protein [Acidobacteriota bacterium]